MGLVVVYGFPQVDNGEDVGWGGSGEELVHGCHFVLLPVAAEEFP